MPGHLSPTTHVAMIGDDLVVLDARANAYFCLPAAAATVRFTPSGVAFDEPDLEAQFAAAGLLTAEPSSSPPPPAPGPRRDLGLATAERVRLGDLVLILAAWLTMFVSYHPAGFLRLLEAARRQRARRPAAIGPDGLSADAVRLVAAFERVLPWLPFQGVCLYRSFLLLRVLHWRGHDARWMFGVQTWPFQAHCWLQVGDVALDDRAERLVGFTPILEV